MDGLVVMLNLAGQALARAQTDIAALQQRIAELEAQAAEQHETERDREA